MLRDSSHFPCSGGDEERGKRGRQGKGDDIVAPLLPPQLLNTDTPKQDRKGYVQYTPPSASPFPLAVAVEVDDRLQDIPLDLLEALQRDYPTIDVSKEIDRAREWARNHTSPEKPLRNAWRFITAWLRNAVAAAAVVTKGAATATTAPANTCPVPTTSGKERGRRPRPCRCRA